jgi:hypothetical protein
MIPYELWQLALQPNPASADEIEALRRMFGYKGVATDWFEQMVSDIRFSLENSTGALTFLDGVHGRSEGVVEEPEWWEPRRNEWLGSKTRLRKVKEWPQGDEYVLRVYAWLDDSYKDGWIEYLVLDVAVYEDELNDVLRHVHPGRPGLTIKDLEADPQAMAEFLQKIRPRWINRSSYSWLPEGYDISVPGFFAAELLTFAPAEPTKGYKTLRSKVARTRGGKALQELLKFYGGKKGDHPYLESEIREFETRQVDFMWRISAAPLDIATMSYDRAWVSCTRPGHAGERTPIYDILAGSAVLFWYRGGGEPCGREILRPAVSRDNYEKLQPVIVRSGSTKGSGGELSDEELQETIQKQTGFFAYVVTGGLGDFDYAVRRGIQDDFDRVCVEQSDKRLHEALDAIVTAFGPMILAAWKAGKLQYLLPPESAEQLAAEVGQQEDEDERLARRLREYDMEAYKLHQKRNQLWKLVNKARTTINAYSQAAYGKPIDYWWKGGLRGIFPIDLSKPERTQKLEKLRARMIAAIDDVAAATPFDDRPYRFWVHAIANEPWSRVVHATYPR